MHQSRFYRLVLIGAVALLLDPMPVHAAAGDELAVIATDPPRHALNVDRATDIRITFDRAVDPATITSATFRVMGRWTGPMPGVFSFEDRDATVVFTPSIEFTAGDPVFVNLSHDVQAADGTFLRSAGYFYQFRTIADIATMVYTPIQIIDVTTGPSNTRIYGGLACDLDQDGWLDLSIINEDSADLRVLMNAADGSGMYGDVLEPTTPIGFGSSPNEAADFNGDGLVDICAAAYADSSVSIVLGNGDGTFQPRQEVGVTESPHGIAVLDVDGDGDSDIVSADTVGNVLSLLLNDGTGVFGPPTSFESGASGEYGLAAADMNNDGIPDLVVGGRFSSDVWVLIGQGDGTFIASDMEDAGGLMWMIVCGDVNGDGNMDVTVANSQSSTASILLGDGTGQIGPPTTYPACGNSIATDLGDLDGDGDLDWVVSCFSGGAWLVYENDGAGNFTEIMEFEAAANAACCVILDVDNDHDLDLALLDEIADIVTIMRNGAVALPDLDGDGEVGASDLAILLAEWGPCPGCVADLNGDGVVNPGDLAILLAAWT